MCRLCGNWFSLFITRSRMFSVVEFNEQSGGGLAVVNSKWFTPLKREVFWPPYKDNKSYLKAVKQGEGVTDKWPLYSITKCYHTTDDYEIASSKLKLAEVTSDLQTDLEEEFLKYSSGKRKVSRPVRFEEEEDIIPNIKRKGTKSTHYDDEDEEPNRSFLPRPPQINRKKIPEETIDYTPSCGVISRKSGIQGGYEASPPLSNSTIVRGSVKITSGTTQDSELLQEATPWRIIQPSNSRDSNNGAEGQGKSVFEILLTNLLEVKQQNKRILSILEKKNNDRITCSLPEDLNIEFPIRTNEDIDKFKAYLSNQENIEGARTVVSYWSSLGGKDCAARTNKILREVLHDSVATKYNFYGRHSKKPFSELKINSEIINAIKISCNTSSREIENIIKIWLKHAPERLKKQELKEVRNHRNN